MVTEAKGMRESRLDKRIIHSSGAQANTHIRGIFTTREIVVLSAPKNMLNGTRGTISIFANGAISDTRPKYHRISGLVAQIAASV